MKKRSFIAALAMLVVSAIVLTSATFAWFSLGERVNVQEIEVNVAQADGLAISATANGTYGPTLNLSAISQAKEYYNFVESDDVLNPVSGNGMKDSDWYMGHMEGSTTILEKMTRSTATGNYTKNRFYCFPVYIKYSGASGTSAIVNIAESTITNNDTNKSTSGGALSAARLAVYPDSASSTKIFVPDPATNEKYYYANSTSTTYPEFTSGVIVTSLSSMDTITLSAGTDTKVWIVLWLEGTDEQCTDEIAAGGSICANIKFTKVSS